jgi:DNA topoisomerase-1
VAGRYYLDYLGEAATAMATRQSGVADPTTSAAAAGLRYADCNRPGLTRARRGKGFVFRDARGRIIRDERTLKRIRSLVLPPAWTDVWIAPDPRAHLQATGRDAAGRKQYRYHALWTAERGSNKYDRMLAFADVLPAIRRRTRRDLLGPACGRPRVLATVVQLLEHTHIRIGNEEYARTNHSHGLTTLRDRHVSVRGQHLRFTFRGKSGVHQTIDLDNPHLAKAVRQCQELPGQTLFQYRDDERKVKSVSSADVNRYLHEISGGAFTAKDFRTWAGTLAAAEALDCAQPMKSATARARVIVKAIDHVADRLGNTRAVCRKCYIHPAVLDAYHAGTTLGRVGRSRARPVLGLRDSEARLVALLSRQPRKKAA